MRIILQKGQLQKFWSNKIYHERFKRNNLLLVFWTVTKSSIQRLERQLWIAIANCEQVWAKIGFTAFSNARAELSWKRREKGHIDIVRRGILNSQSTVKRKNIWVITCKSNIEATTILQKGQCRIIIGFSAFLKKGDQFEGDLGQSR